MVSAGALYRRSDEFCSFRLGNLAYPVSTRAELCAVQHLTFRWNWQTDILSYRSISLRTANKRTPANWNEFCRAYRLSRVSYDGTHSIRTRLSIHYLSICRCEYLFIISNLDIAWYSTIIFQVFFPFSSALHLLSPFSTHKAIAWAAMTNEQIASSETTIRVHPMMPQKIRTSIAIASKMCRGWHMLLGVTHLSSFATEAEYIQQTNLFMQMHPRLPVSYSRICA